MTDIAENIRRIRFDIEEAKVRSSREGDTIRIMAVTKTVPPERVNEAVSCGLTLLGENRVQEYLSKKDAYSPGAEVHMIGRLQSNKIKYIIDDVAMIQSVDSLSLAAQIGEKALLHGKVMDVLCEVNVGAEESKSGFDRSAVGDALAVMSQTEGIRVRGLMVIPPPGESERYFEITRELYEEFKGRYSLDTLSMGMSADYALAVEYGSTLVRIGTGIFGKRDYSIH